jgi:hypothetical protein
MDSHVAQWKKIKSPEIDPNKFAQLIIFSFETETPCVPQASPELLGSSDPPASAS